ncbi:putative Fe-S oxidoreductase [Candidatus Nitrososphaera evergladensis SR1]|jgi:Fe-S-cluster containining protein|uniref:Putative Fe-S oxidoreductase n=1 Tax=Candidatus Nitrososphaera evergladensis SR1 TaxID=1459636 RepID=A0A075MR84_9ARCH|nr:YkgJ family cysteine cluster protein [Candidatus Nitrososphaera evergladensis]AIF83322.1 putative Fe-S oxidoreductase [Candidatus Nitrososphaera evergladensis SR1]
MHNTTTRRKQQPVKKKFACVQGCSDCCIYREYYPSPDFGKIGVLLLPEEKGKMEKLAKEKGIEIRIVPRLAVGGTAGPEKIIAYQMMGKQKDGDLCPFLDLEKPSPHGGFACGIYAQRPLACSAYPVVDAGSKDVTLDPHCQFCKHNHNYSTKASLEGLENELESLSKIKAAVKAENGVHVWRYATATGEQATLDEGWVLES